MSQGISLTALIWIGITVVILGCNDQDASTPQGFGSTGETVVARHYRDGAYQGYTNYPGVQIYWAGMTSNGATPEQVIGATIERLQFEQTTALASDQNAKVLSLLLQAKIVLSGESQFTADGLPILE